ncbi:MAG TPA: CsgG/HfaB family protein [Spirochaetota bacterium]|nr:CsgG/HfaB family protein [Spirochaetota bacterium]
MGKFVIRMFLIILPVIGFESAYSAQIYDSDAVFKKLAEKISEVKGRLPNKTIAVYGFEVIGKKGDPYSRYATEKLTHEIVTEGELMVIERSRIDQVLKEQSLSLTGAVDSGTAAKIGKILAVDAVVIGTIHVSRDRTELIARVIQSEKGIILASAAERIDSLSDESSTDEWNSSSDTEETYQGSKSVSIKGAKTAYSSSERITVKFFGLPGDQYDWITLIKASAPDTTYGEWFYTKGQRSGTYSFRPVAPGNYEVRVYFSWPAGGYKVQKRLKVKVR